MSEVFAGMNRQYHKELQEEIGNTEKTILGGSITSFDEYKRLVGKRQALVKCLERHKELITLLEQR